MNNFKKFYVGIDKNGYQKKPDNIAKVKQDASRGYDYYSLDEIADAVGNQGRAIIPSVLVGGLSQVNFAAIQIFMLDFDGMKNGKGTNLSFDEVRTRASKYGLKIAFAYRTLSCPDEVPFYKFRIAFVHRVLVDNASIAVLIYRMLLKIFPEADPSCGETARLFLGGKQLIYKDVNALFDVVYLYHSIQDILNKDNHGYRNAISLTKKTDIAVIDGMVAIEYLSNASIFGVKPDSNNIYILSQSDSPPIFYIKSDAVKQHLIKKHQSNTREEKKDKSSITYDNCKGICKLLDVYMADEQELDHNERFLLLTNYKEYRNGYKYFFEVMQNSKFYDIESYEKWVIDYKGIIRKYKPKVCDNSCRFYKECRNKSTIVNKINNSRKLVVSEKKLCTIEEATASLHEKLLECTETNRSGIHLVKAQTGLGKTREIIKYVKEHPKKRILIAEPLCAMKKELYDKICMEVPKSEIKNVLSIKDSSFLNKIIDKYQKLHDSGRHIAAMKLLYDELERTQKEEPECEAKIKELMEITEGVKDTDQYRIVLMTHARMLNTPETEIRKYDVVFIDEDILYLALIPKTHIISDSCLQRIAEDNNQNHKYYTSVAQEMLKNNKPNYYYLYKGEQSGTCIPEWNEGRKEQDDSDDFDEYGDFIEADENNNITDLREMRAYTYRDGYYNYWCYKALPEAHYIVLSATADEKIYGAYFKNSMQVYEYIVNEAYYKGKLVQYTYYGLGRSKLDQCREKVYKMIREIHVDEVISFKSEYEKGYGKNKARLYFGNAVGVNDLEGKDLAIVGTPFKNEDFYKLPCCFLFGEEVVNNQEMRHRRITFRNISFQIMTYKPEPLQHFMLYSLDSELEQCIGRARLLRYDCTVFLWSSFPCSQAKYCMEDYLIQDDEST